MKKSSFSNGESKDFKIDKKNDLDEWLEVCLQNSESNHPTRFIYRGVSEAKYKLYTSAQRLWIINNFNNCANKSYLDFIIDIVNKAKMKPLIKKVFNLYGYNNAKRELPILSILQHYGAPTALMDWTYNKYVACYFATNNLVIKEAQKYETDDYFSVYSIDRSNYKKEFMSNIDYWGSRPLKIEDLKKMTDDSADKENFIFYFSDFESLKVSNLNNVESKKKRCLNTKNPITTIFNQNIIAQEGLFIFNPYSNKPLEEMFHTDNSTDGYSLVLTPFECHNINKGLAEYLRRKIDLKYNVNKDFVYPEVYKLTKNIADKAIDSLII